jgi:hypothetical protein
VEERRFSAALTQSPQTLVIPTEVRSGSDGEWRNLLSDSAISDLSDFAQRAKDPEGTFLRPPPYPPEGVPMFTFLLWCILFVLCWPLAILALIAYPFVWLLLLPFRILGIAVHGALELVYLAITLPFRLLSAPFRI